MTPAPERPDLPENRTDPLGFGYPNLYGIAGPPYIAAAPVTDAGLREALKREIHHAIDNGHVITDGQGIAPGERVPAVRIDYLRAARSRQAEKETG